MARTAPTQLLDPTLLAAIGDLELLARTVVDGFLHGHHRSSRTGSSTDFAQHRSYQPGDDLRRVDWKLYGRTERFYLRTYEAETNADLRVALDVSGSMDFGTGAMTKFAWGRALLASLAWLAQRQGDRVGSLPLGDKGGEVVTPSTRHLPLVLQTLARAVPSGELRLGAALERAANLKGRAGMVAIVSDAYDDPAAIQRGVGALRARGHDVMFFHVLDAAERDFPFEAPETFADLETGARIALQPTEIRDAYMEAIGNHVAEVQRRVGNDGGDYLTVYTDEPLDRALRAWLELRHHPVGGR